MVVVDRFTKYAHFVPLRHPFTSVTVARAFWDQIIKLHGVPHSIVSDRDRVFTSAMWRAIFEAAGTKLSYSTAYHPQTDGQSERVNQCLEMYLRCAVHDQPKKWRQWLSTAEFWYNTTHHSSLNTSPFKALYAKNPIWEVCPRRLPNYLKILRLIWTGLSIMIFCEHSWLGHRTDTNKRPIATERIVHLLWVNKCYSNSSRMLSLLSPTALALS